MREKETFKYIAKITGLIVSKLYKKGIFDKNDLDDFLKLDVKKDDKK